jgi:hypothetical protein
MVAAEYTSANTIHHHANYTHYPSSANVAAQERPPTQEFM